MDATPASAATPDLAAASYGETIPAVESARRDYLLGLHPVAASAAAPSPVSLREPALPGGSDDVAALASARPARGEMEDTKLEAAE